MRSDISEFLRHQFKVLGIHDLLETAGVTEICINEPGRVFVENGAEWRQIDVPDLTYERARHFCISVVNESNTGQRITDQEPMVSLAMANGARAQLVMPPACEPGKVSITLRIPSRVQKTLTDYAYDGFFDRTRRPDASATDAVDPLETLLSQGRHAEFFELAVTLRKNIVVAGATGSGKTTFMKALVANIPRNERLISIEDAREIELPQPNHVHLLFPKNAQSNSNVTAKSCMEACLRMRPDRIILAELRGDEAFYFIRNCASGHPGSITSCHAGSPRQTWDQLALMIKASPEGAGLDFDSIVRLLKSTIDIVVHVQVHAGRRFISGIEYGHAH
ncbi:P-type DNA transfer ATPase VirB11 [Lysobacter soyae]|uniref:Type IV secretion system protein n=1 Tax=Lysobacter soyae TaxID=2764185 RepID=A0ABX8WSB7_9GAMM|nr:P-type DNA transfer ATPase VirB11 [Lysobacter sp. CJ11]QYR53732.1 P-type DNA transfer ATPase VirB11 [Lysobacter sp. CJ11]